MVGKDQKISNEEIAQVVRSLILGTVEGKIVYSDPSKTFDTWIQFVQQLANK